MLFSMQLLYFYKQPPSPLFPSLPRQLVHSDQAIFKNSRVIIINPSSSFSSCCIVHAAKEDSEQYEIDPDKARESLKELDQQIQSLSNEQVSSPKVRVKVSDVKLAEDQVSGSGSGSGTDKIDISDSFLASLAGGLLFFSIFYNVLFYTVIKPSIDGPSP
ncbi:uncharacterized protein LOC130723622 [Lotus japonicus]|uniref:Transmembrane protein n=1 Tax=Lotus japonicus TaxID=34305 RepID=I3SKW9_LOTJA|nr:uncharacterized protein LOC130723622 [Lotus japonicus]AFK40911.1 unknown [Lotus japonicus]